MYTPPLVFAHCKQKGVNWDIALQLVELTLVYKLASVVIKLPPFSSSQCRMVFRRYDCVKKNNKIPVLVV